MTGFLRQLRDQGGVLASLCTGVEPVEPVWSYLKMNPLANLPAQDVIELAWLAEEAAQGM